MKGFGDPVITWTRDDGKKVIKKEFDAEAVKALGISETTLRQLFRDLLVCNDCSRELNVPLERETQKVSRTEELIDAGRVFGQVEQLLWLSELIKDGRLRSIKELADTIDELLIGKLKFTDACSRKSMS